MNFPGAKLLPHEHSRTQTRPAPATTRPEATLLPLSLTAVQRKRGQRLMNQEGVVWSFMNAITGGTVVTAFALHLQADSFAIGLLSALPLLAALFQLWTPQFVAFFGSRKTVCVLTAIVSRLLWLPVALLAFAAWRWPDAYPGWLLLFLALVTLSAAFNSLTGSAWLSWAGAVVPLSQRASYFARRNLMVGFGGLVVSLLVGWLLDWWSEPTKTGRQPHPGVYMLLFSMASVFGIFTVLLLRRTPDLMVASSGPRPRFKDSLLGTWNRLNLRKYLIFRSAWLFAVGIVVPYYTVYMLQNLRMSFTEIFLLQNIGAAAGLVGFTFWGRILDKYGCTRVLWWTSWLKVFYVIGWAFVGAGQPFWPLALLHLTLIIDSGMNLAAGNLLMNLMPNHNADNVGYFSVFTAVTSLVSAVGPFLAGLLIGLIAHNQLGLWGFSFDALQLMFLLSGLLRLLSLGLFRGFKEE